MSSIFVIAQTIDSTNYRFVYSSEYESVTEIGDARCNARIEVYDSIIRVIPEGDLRAEEIVWDDNTEPYYIQYTFVPMKAVDLYYKEKYVGRVMFDGDGNFSGLVQNRNNGVVIIYTK